jgi:hypothetical protein
VNDFWQTYAMLAGMGVFGFVVGYAFGWWHGRHP